MVKLLDIRNMKKSFVLERTFLGKPKKVLHAVQDVSLSLDEGETVGLVGESGCGKSTFARTVMGLYKKTAGTILYKGQDIDDPAVHAVYKRQVQMIFQDPYASLDPRMTVEDIISEPFINYGVYPCAKERRHAVESLLSEVDLSKEAIQRYPHEFSGGQRQRIGIARALALGPACIFCDEPVSALDVSVQVQIINMLKRLQEERHLSYVFIAHDLSLVHHISHRIGVMYLGRLVELGPSDGVYHRPLHPYTKGLIEAIPRPDPKVRQQKILVGEVPSPLDPPKGCVFHPRCPYKTDICRCQVPALRLVDTGRFVACHHVKKGDEP